MTPFTWLFYHVHSAMSILCRYDSKVSTNIDNPQHGSRQMHPGQGGGRKKDHPPFCQYVYIYPYPIF